MVLKMFSFWDRNTLARECLVCWCCKTAIGTHSIIKLICLRNFNSFAKANCAKLNLLLKFIFEAERLVSNIVTNRDVYVHIRREVIFLMGSHPKKD